MRRRLIGSYLALIGVVLFVLQIPLGYVLARSEELRATEALERDTAVLAAVAGEGLRGGDLAGFETAARRYLGDTSARLVLVDSGGQVLADMGSLAVAGAPGPPSEIVDALEGRQQSYVVDTSDGRAIVAGAPVSNEGEIDGALAVAESAEALDGRIRGWWSLLAMSGAGLLAVAAIVANALSRSLSTPLARLRRGAARLAGGDLSARVSESGPEELRGVSVAFNDMARRLEGVLEAQRAFVSDASHQLRTPLTALRLRLENLEQDVDPPARQEIAVIADEVARFSRLVEGLLVMARDQDGPQRLEPVDVAAALAERRRSWEPVAEEQGVGLTAAASNGVLAHAVPGSVDQILDNLIDNALAVAPPGTEVALRAVAADPWIEIHVCDEGPGMGERARRRAFDRFWTHPAPGREGGSGLGLAIVRQLAEAAGGQAELRPGPRTGTDAVVRLPPVPQA